MIRFFLQSIFISVIMTIVTLYLLLQYLQVLSDGRANSQAKSYEQTVNVEEEDMILHFINLQIGKTTMIQMAHRAALIDVGHKDDSEALLSYLQEHGVSEVSDIFLSNPAEENVSGLPSLLKKFPSAKVHIPELTKDRYQLDKSTFLMTVRAGDHLLLSEDKKIEFEILSPLRPLYPDDANNSLVGLLRYQDLRILLTNDIHEEAEARLVEQHPMLRAEIMTVPDRPTGVQNSQKLINKLNPQAAIMLEIPCSGCKEAVQEAAREYAQEWTDFFFVPIGENLLISFHNGLYTTPKEQTK